ncbi:MAG: hypothetical protein J6X28_01205 [Bacilli bacterium]|nr:hypothetical protein [Bacilli bacterium]
MPLSDTNVTDYGIFGNAVTSTKTYGTKIDTAEQDMQTVKTTLSDGSVLMGPFQDECSNELQKLGTDFSTMKSTFETISSFLLQTAGQYKTGDVAAANVASNITSTSSAEAISSGNMVSYTYDGKNFNVVNTKTSINDYQAYVKQNGLYQNAGLLGGECMLLSQYYAKDMLTGKNTSKSTMASLGGSPATRINEKSTSPEQEDVLKYMYSELAEGHPVVLQVTQRDPHGRHLVTAVGFNSSVTSAADLTPENILVLDCVDGEIQTLDKRGRTLKKTTNYQAIGPTDTFLASEVGTNNNTTA